MISAIFSSKARQATADQFTSSTTESILSFKWSGTDIVVRVVFFMAVLQKVRQSPCIMIMHPMHNVNRVFEFVPNNPFILLNTPLQTYYMSD